MVKKAGLGRGFDSLIPTELLDEDFDPTASQDERVSSLKFIKLADLEANREQPRRDFSSDELNELADSVKQHGVLQPIVVSPLKGDKFQIVAGERRFRAAKLAGLSEIPAIVRTLSNQNKLELALIENIQRQNLNPMETATAYLKLHQQFNMSYQQIGKRVGKALSTISNYTRLLNLSERGKQAVASGQISEGHGRQLVGLKPEDEAYVLERIIKDGWSVRATEHFVAQLNKAGKRVEIRPESRKPIETPATRSLAKKLNSKVKIKAGQIVISFSDEADLDRILDYLNR